MKRLYLFCFCCWSFYLLKAQPPGNKPIATVQISTPAVQNPDSARRSIKILNSERIYVDQKDSFRTIAGNVQIKHEETLFKADSVYYSEKGRYMEAFGRVYINEADSVITTCRYVKYFLDTRIAHLKNDVNIKTKSGSFSGSAAEYDMNSKLATYDKPARIRSRNSTLTSRGGQYYSSTRDALFTGNVVLNGPEYDVFTDTLFYNTNTEIANFVTYTRVVNRKKKQEIETTEGFYDMRRGIASFTESTVIRDSTRVIAGKKINMDEKARTLNIHQGYILDTAKGQYISGIDIAVDDKNKYLQIAGNGVFKDSIEGFVITGNYIFADDKTGRSMATGKPVAIIKQENDSIYIAADTLFSGRIVNSYKTVTDTLVRSGDSMQAVTKQPAGSQNPARNKRRKKNEVPPPQEPVVQQQVDSLQRPADTLARAGYPIKTFRPLGDTSGRTGPDTVRYFEGFHHVRVFSDSAQAVCDSIYYSTADSVFRLYQEPVVWNSNGENQVTGDTMYLYTKNKKAHRVEVFENGLLVNRVEKKFFNQIRGNAVTGWFTDGELDSLIAKGSSEIIFYIQDEDSSFVGVDQSKADLITAFFQKREIIKIKWINQYEATTIPMKEADHGSLRLRNFGWHEKRRPKSKFELFF